MSGKVFLINVGSNANHSFCSPIFDDRTFEFIPIPEDIEGSYPHGIKYKDLRSYYDPSRDLDLYVPENLREVAMHNDPEFDTFTYGDNCDVNPRASALRKVSRGDFLIFISRLQNWTKGAPTNIFGFYLIGYIHVDQVVGSVVNPLEKGLMSRFSVNAHVRAAMFDKSMWNSFWLFSGSSWSKRFLKAVPVTKKFCDDVFRKSNGQKWDWGENRTDLQVIGSYTRTCRPILNSNIESDHKRIDILWKLISKYSE